MRVLCGILVLLALGLVSGTAVAGLSGSAAPGAITGTISVTTAVPTASVPTVAVTLPVTTVTSPTTVPTLPVTVTVPVTTAVTVPVTTAVTVPPTTVATTTAATTPSATTTARLPVTTTAAAATSAATTVASTPTASTVPSGPAGSAPGSTSRGGAGSATEPAPPQDRDALGGVTFAPDGAIGTGFATTERPAADLRLQLARPGAKRPMEPVGAGGSSLPRSSTADGTQDEGTRVEAAPVGFVRPGADEGRGSSSPGDLVAELPRIPLGMVLLGLAALLVGIAAIPREAIPPGRVGSLVAERRLELVSVGATVLVTAVLTLALA